MAMFSEGTTPRRSDTRWVILQKILQSSIDGGGGGGAGTVAAEGTNYCITGTAPNQVLRIKNTDTGLSNALHMLGADGDQGLGFDDGVAC